MYKAIKIEIKLTEEQKTQVNKTIGTEIIRNNMN